MESGRLFILWSSSGRFMSQSVKEQGGIPEEENHRRWQVSRRLLQLMGAAGTTAVVGRFIPPVFAKSDGNGRGPEEGGKRLRRWAMVIDLRYCDGCQSAGTPPQCTEACIQGHYVPEPMEWMECYERELPGGGTQFIPVLCQHCQNAPCVNVCPVGATWATP